MRLGAGISVTISIDWLIPAVKLGAQLGRYPPTKVYSSQADQTWLGKSPVYDGISHRKTCIYSLNLPAFHVCLTKGSWMCWMRCWSPTGWPGTWGFSEHLAFPSHPGCGNRRHPLHQPGGCIPWYPILCRQGTHPWGLGHGHVPRNGWFILENAI